MLRRTFFTRVSMFFFRKAFRMSRTTFEKLLEAMGPGLTQTEAAQRKARRRDGQQRAAVFVPAH